MKLLCNRCGVNFDKPKSECNRYNREHKEGLCPNCKVSANKHTLEIVKEVMNEFNSKGGLRK